MSMHSAFKWIFAALLLIVLVIGGTHLAARYFAQEWGDALHGARDEIGRISVVREEVPPDSWVFLGDEPVANLVSETRVRDSSRAGLMERVYLAAFRDQQTAERVLQTGALIGVIQNDTEERLAIQLHPTDAVEDIGTLVGRVWLVFPSTFVPLYDRLGL